MIKQKRDAGEITGFLHQVKAQRDAQHKGSHHQRKKEYIDQNIADKRDQKRVYMNRRHPIAQYHAERRQNRRCRLGYHAGEEHRQQEDQKYDPECHQLSPNGRKSQTIKFSKSLTGTLIRSQHTIQQTVDILCFFFGGMHSLPCDLRLLDEGGLNGLTEGAVVLFADSGHGYHRDSQLV